MRPVRATRVRSLASSAIAALVCLGAPLTAPAGPSAVAAVSSDGLRAVGPPLVGLRLPTRLPSAVGSVRWTTTAVNVRGHPSLASNPLFVLAPRTAVRVVRSASDTQRRTWYLVRVHRRLGWLAAWLTRASPTAPSAAGAIWHAARASSFGIGDGLLGLPMACGGRLTNSILAVANLHLRCGTRVRIRARGHVVTAQVLDRGPYVAGRSFDLGPAVCRALRVCDGVFWIDWQLVG